MLSVVVSIDSVNSLCEFVCVMCFSIYGIVCVFIMSISIKKSVIFFSVSKRVSMMVLLVVLLFLLVLLFRMFVSVGSRISVRIMVRFLMISYFIVMWLLIEFSVLWCFSVWSSMIVEVIERVRLNMMFVLGVYFYKCVSFVLSRVVVII